MKTKIIILLLYIFTVVWVSEAKPFINNPPKSKVMILGSYHMANPGLDTFNTQADDVTTPKRQQEIEELVVKLMKFNPTHILVEIDSKNDSAVNVQYSKYLKGDFALPANESYQIGFRLAKASGSKKVYCIDESGNFDFGKLMGFAQANGYGKMMESATATVQNRIGKMEKRLKEVTLAEYYKEKNHPDNHRQSHQLHLDLLQVSNKTEFAGADMLTDLYERNLKILSHVIKISNEDPNSRILIIFGDGHSAFFKSILALSTKIEIVESYDYLK